MAIGAKPANQNRSIEKKERILKALDHLLKKKSFEQISIAEVAARAKVSPATIYQRFNNRDALLAILIELYFRRVQEWAEANQDNSEILTADNVRQALITLGRNSWRQAEALEYLLKPAYLYSRLRPDLLGPTWQQLEQRAFSGFKQFLSKFENEFSGQDIDRCANGVAYFYNLMLVGRLLHRDSGSVVLKSENDFANSLADFALGYLKGHG